jgi:putative intracellular protease/amidase
MNILMVLTSHDQLGDTGHKTGFWLEEFAAPYYALKDAGAHLTLASPLGGQPPLDPKSDAPESQTAATARFKADPAAQAALASTSKLAAISASDFDAVFYPGGHGPLWDLAEDRASIALIEAMSAAGKPVAAVCHAPGVLRHAKAADGSALVRGKNVTGFTNTEEEAVGLTQVVPFLVEDMLKENGGLYSKAADWQSYVVTDGLLITGQNPASSEAAAAALLKRRACVGARAPRRRTPPMSARARPGGAARQGPRARNVAGSAAFARKIVGVAHARSDYPVSLAAPCRARRSILSVSARRSSPTWLSTAPSTIWRPHVGARSLPTAARRHAGRGMRDAMRPAPACTSPPRESIESRYRSWRATRRRQRRLRRRPECCDTASFAACDTAPRRVAGRTPTRSDGRATTPNQRPAQTPIHACQSPYAGATRRSEES